MRWIFTNPGRAILLAMILSSPIAAQTRVEVSKHLTPIPKSCRSLSPAAIDPTVDIQALVKEAICKGSGDMLIDYTYVVDSVKREKDRKGKVVKEERITYEVFIPTLKSGAHTRGVLVVTSRNQVPVPPAELQKERVKAAERIEKEENKIAGETSSAPEVNLTPITGMMPLGQYMRSGINRVSFGGGRGGVSLAITTFIRDSELSLTRRETIDGRETLIFSFTPRPDAKFAENEKYVAQLRGEIWIDVQDRIATRLIGRPLSTPAEEPPAVYVEMMRLPQHGVWFPHVTRINGGDYPKLFDGIVTDVISTYSNYIRFSIEVNNKVGTPNDF
jgi:hypothetical protein